MTDKGTVFDSNPRFSPIGSIFGVMSDPVIFESTEVSPEDWSTPVSTRKIQILVYSTALLDTWDVYIAYNSSWRLMLQIKKPNQ